MAQKFEIEYIDNTTEEIAITIFDSVQAEKYLRAHGLGTIQESSVQASAFMIYSNLRRNNRTEGKDFETWLQNVTNINLINGDDADNPLA